MERKISVEGGLDLKSRLTRLMGRDHKRPHFKTQVQQLQNEVYGIRMPAWCWGVGEDGVSQKQRKLQN